MTLAGLGILAILKGINSLITAQPDYTNAVTALFITLLFGSTIWWLTKLKLKVVISDKKIKYKMSPIHMKKHTILWKDAEKCEIVKTTEAAQWSGDNITFNHEKRISFCGRNGLAIQTKQGNKYLIGCSNVSKLQEVLDVNNLRLS